MISIARHMDEYDIAQEIRLERRVHKGSFLLLEGDTDIKRFERFVDQVACSTVNSYGRRKAIATIEMLYDEGFEGVVAIIDADFDRLTGRLNIHEGLIYSSSHDLDLDWVTTTVLARYLIEVGDRAKCEAHGTAAAIFDKVLQSLKPISVTRLLNDKGYINYRLSDIDISKCTSGFSIDVDNYVELIFGDRAVADATKSALKIQIDRALAVNSDDPRQITNGHDFHCFLGVLLRRELGLRRDPQTWGKEVEIHLRLAFDDKDFRESHIYRSIIDWCRENPPFQVLLPEFASPP